MARKAIKISVQRVRRAHGFVWLARWRADGKHHGRVLGESAAARDAGLEDLRAELAAMEGREFRSSGAALESFLTYCRAVRQLKPATLRFYREKIGRLFESAPTRRLEDWTRRDLEQYIAANPQWAPRSVQALITSCRTFIAWAQDNGIACPDFVGRMRAPRVTPPPREVLTVDQLRAVLKAAEGGRLEVPIALASFCGLSFGDLCALQWDQVSLRRGWITLPRKKTGKPIAIPIIPPLREVLLRQPGPRKGAVCPHIPTDPGNAGKMLNRVLERAGIPRAPRGNNGWHRFRHSCGTLLAGLGVPHAVVARILAHSSAMSARYIHPSDDAVKTAMQRLADEWSKE